MLIGPTFRYGFLQVDLINFVVESFQVPTNIQWDTFYMLITYYIRMPSKSNGFELCVCTYSSLIAANCVGVRRSWSGNDSKASVNQENRSPIIFDLMAWPILTLLRLLYLNRGKVWCRQISHFYKY